MFLLVSVRHIGAHPDGHQHGVSIQISINLGKSFLRISRIRIIPSTEILARVFVHLRIYISQILDFIYLMMLTLILIYFESRDTENQQFYYVSPCFPVFSPVFLCFPLFSPVLFSFPPFSYVFPCFPMFSPVFCFSLFYHVFLCFLMFP